MKSRTKIDGVEIELDDGDINTSYITELDGELADEADDELEKSRIQFLISRGYTVIKE